MARSPPFGTMWNQVLASAGFGAYFGLVLISFLLVFRSILDGRKGTDLASGKPFLYLRTALGALLCTWYCQCPPCTSYSHCAKEEQS